MAKKKSIDRNFISSIDQALQAFDRTHSPSIAQQAEIEKYTRINLLRDNAISVLKKDKDIWDLED